MSNNEHVFTLVMNGGWHGELCRMAGDAAAADVEHNFSMLATAAAKRDASVVWTRGELKTDVEMCGGWDLGNVVKVS